MRTDFKSKFGIPRQSGLADGLKGQIVFEPKFNRGDALRGMEGFSHIWVIWGFSENPPAGGESLTVRPPRLGGNKRVGVFASRSPFRPNPIGLSALKIESIEKTAGGTVINVSGADMADGTPIYDIKPYLPLSDCIADAANGYAEEGLSHRLTVDFPPALLAFITEDKRTAIIGALACDPRPAYHDDCRAYGFPFADCEIKFRVDGNILTVTDVTKNESR